MRVAFDHVDSTNSTAQRKESPLGSWGRASFGAGSVFLGTSSSPWGDTVERGSRYAETGRQTGVCVGGVVRGNKANR